MTATCAMWTESAPGEVREGMMAGYLLVPHDRVEETYDAGFSMYVTAWPLLREYPGNRFQTGLFGTWMFAQNSGPKPTEKLHSDIEGGLGWWRDTRFATETPKFIMGGVAPNFSSWANGPGAGKGRDWDKPNGKYGVAQLSPGVLWPPDGLNLKQGTCGEPFGYGYLPLPLRRPKSRTAGKEVPTGSNCWTLFLNTGNFKGPVAFFTPYFFSRVKVARPDLAGTFLDSRPSNPNRAIQMETQYVPAMVAYSWYRFADQPALLNADLADEEREELQKRVETLHRHWGRDREYLPPPAVGTLAEIDPALIVSPPPGLEAGYVPIVTEQRERE